MLAKPLLTVHTSHRCQLSLVGHIMDLFELEALLLTAQKDINAGRQDDATRAIIAAKLMVQAEMARIGRIATGTAQTGDDRRKPQ